MKIRRMMPLVYILILVFTLSACHASYKGADETVTLRIADENAMESVRNTFAIPPEPTLALTPLPSHSPSPTIESAPEPSPKPTPEQSPDTTSTPYPTASATPARSAAMNNTAAQVSIAIQVPNVSPAATASATPPTATASASTTGSDKVELPYIEYDQETVRAGFLRGMNDAKAAKGYPMATLSSELNAIAQERANQMAAAGKAWHIGDGYSEAVGEITGGPGAYNRGYHSISHSPPLAGYTNIGIGVAIAEDRMIYYSIIGSMATE